MDSELIRKAAEAIQDSWRDVYRAHFPMGRHECDVPFDELSPLVKEYTLGAAAAALQVFYEHTRSQDRERIPPSCPDCGMTMRWCQNISGIGGVWGCATCGATRG